MLEGSCVGPFSERGLNEAFRLSVGLRGVRFGGEVFDSELFAGMREGLQTIATAIIGHDATDSNAEAFVVGNGGAQKGNGAVLLLIWKDVGASDAGMVIDGDVNEVPADALPGRARNRGCRSPTPPSRSRGWSRRSGCRGRACWPRSGRRRGVRGPRNPLGAASRHSRARQSCRR